MGGPGRWWYLVAALVGLAGLAVAGLVALRTFQGAGEDLQRVVVPGEAEVLVDEPGTYTIYYEYRSVVDGRLFATHGADVSALRVAVEDADTGEDVTLTPPRGNVEYQLGTRAGRAAFNFHAGDPGRYLVAAGYPEGSEGPEVVLAIGQGVGRRIATGVLAAIAIPVAAFGLAGATAALTFVRRRRARSTA